MSNIANQLSRNLDQVRLRIDRAAGRSGRTPDAVRLVAVTKYVDVEVARILSEIGISDLAESRPQELWHKAEILPPHHQRRWHLVGPLQRNKIRRTLPWVSMIHSVDSFRLLEAIDRIAVQLGQIADVLLEVNISNDAAKQGLRPEDVGAILERASGLSGIRLCGLMGMAGLESQSDRIHREFSLLRATLDAQRSTGAAPASFRELSMGMSGDFEIAIEEGATLVRLGSILFSDRP